MGTVIELHEGSEALSRLRRREGSGFAYCPPPTPAVDRAYERGAVYTSEVLLLITIGCAGAAWMIGEAFWRAWFRGA